jgi:tRNA-uridine 2-sulfurtransferase
MSNQSKVIVGISGGIDSAVTAAKLKAEGFDVIGIHLAISFVNSQLKQKLNSISEIVGIPIEIVEVTDRFKTSVIDYFRSELLAGRSPSPCAYCNPTFKWKILLEMADAYNATSVASGHYVNKINQNGQWYIQQGFDAGKDQSYYMWNLKQEYLNRMLFPLGGQTKLQTKETAKQLNLDFLINQKESTGLCFSEGLSYPDLIKKLAPEAESIPQGEVVDISGNVIGNHNGYIYYTIGQKRDLHFFEPSDNCVIEIKSDKNQLVAGSPKELWKTEFFIFKENFIEPNRILNNKEVSVKIRGFGWNPDGYCKVEQLTNDLFRVILDKPAWAPAPGQPAVFYENNILLGGAFIC